jgi:hypothetical protein
MTADDIDDIEQIRRHAAQLGISLPPARTPAPVLGCFGHQLPVSFVWFCRHYPQHAGFPHGSWTPPMGLLSPFGHPSGLKRRNDEIRKCEPKWPAHWISFWHGSDGDYCFSYDHHGHPWIVYWDYNSYTPGTEDDEIALRDDYAFTDFADWLSPD